jgi:hypothetical protein
VKDAGIAHHSNRSGHFVNSRGRKVVWRTTSSPQLLAAGSLTAVLVVAAVAYGTSTDTAAAAQGGKNGKAPLYLGVQEMSEPLQVTSAEKGFVTISKPSRPPGRQLTWWSRPTST